MEILETSLNDFDILVVTETHLDNKINDSDIALDSFPNIIHQKDRSNSGGRLFIYSKNDISISRKSELENNLDETIWGEIRSKGQSFLLCITYRHSCTDIDYWTRSLRIMGSNKVIVLPLILVGLSITFLRLKIFTRSRSLLLFEHNRFELRSPVIMMFSFP
jgi:hypothetical protein